MNEKLILRIYLGVSSAVAILAMLAVTLNSMVILNGEVTREILDLAFLLFIAWFLTCGIPGFNLAIVIVMSFLKRKFLAIEFFLMLILCFLEVGAFFMAIVFSGYM